MLISNQPSVWATCKGKAGNHKHYLRLASLSHISCIITIINTFSNRTKYTRDCSTFWALGQITPLYESQRNAEFFSVSLGGVSIPGNGQGAFARLDQSQGFTRGAALPSLGAVLTCSAAQRCRRCRAGFCVSSADSPVT